jgi:cobalt/nickel transport system permease protein
MFAVTAGVSAYSVRRIHRDFDDKKIPLMGVMGAFVFTAQMINFTIPGTGSSGHIAGALLLSILLEPYAAFLCMASILLIQALFFADGGLLAWGCNVFNMSFYACFLTYPLIYKKIAGAKLSVKRIFTGSILASVVGLQLGAFSVVIETMLSGISELPFGTFVLLMQPIHLAIGVVEGIITGAVIMFVWKARPELLERTDQGKSFSGVNTKKVIAGFVAAAIVTGGCLSWFASAYPDGLEWSMFKTAGTTELEKVEGVHQALNDLQHKTSILPDYSFKSSGDEEEGSWPAVSAGTSFSGIVGGAMTLVLAGGIGGAIWLVKRKGKGAKASKE